MGDDMEAIIAVIVSLLAGMGLGVIFFLGLWKTVKNMSRFERPYLWIFVSFITRLTIVLLGFYLIMQVQWQLVAVALLGFVFARYVVVQYTLRNTKSIERGS